LNSADEISEYVVESWNTFIYEPGYVTLFPLFFGTVDSLSANWAAIFSIMLNKDHLWSDFGIRSLSKKSKYYGTEEDYWRGAIWMPINYLVLRAIKYLFS
jgi:mannosyl-oligosaccharide glucosidase